MTREEKEAAIGFSEWLGNNRYRFFYSNGIPMWYSADTMMDMRKQPTWSTEHLLEIYLTSLTPNTTIE